MLSPTRVRLAGVSGIAIAALVLPGAAFAGSSGTIAQTGGMTATLPILGTSLSVGVTLDASGNLSQVNLDPIGTYTGTALGAHAVTFATADGVTRVKIRAGSARRSIQAGTASLDNLFGSGTWSADVFGTKAQSTVGYTIGKASDGSPTVTIDSVGVAAGFAGGEHTGMGGTLVSGVKVSFTGTDTMVIAAVVKLADGSYVLAVSGLGSHCALMNGKPPVVNTPVAPTATRTGSGGGFDVAHIRLVRFGTRHHHRSGFGR